MGLIQTNVSDPGWEAAPLPSETLANAADEKINTSE